MIATRTVHELYDTIRSLRHDLLESEREAESYRRSCHSLQLAVDEQDADIQMFKREVEKVRTARVLEVPDWEPPRPGVTSRERKRSLIRPATRQLSPPRPRNETDTEPTLRAMTTLMRRLEDQLDEERRCRLALTAKLQGLESGDNRLPGFDGDALPILSPTYNASHNNFHMSYALLRPEAGISMYHEGDGRYFVIRNSSGASPSPIRPNDTSNVMIAERGGAAFHVSQPGSSPRAPGQPERSRSAFLI